ncbi:MAG: carboxypeptidase regulatory-like domain-containing protein [Terriglobia bacterium]
MSTFLLALLFLFAAPQQKTPTQNPADLCTIQGVVVKAGTGEPLRKATVAAIPTNGQLQVAETDAMGRFELKGLYPGRYSLAAQHNGFVKQRYGQRSPQGTGTTLTLSSGQKISDITFQLIPSAVITGHVYDEDGEPVLGAQVTVMEYVYIDGQRQLERNQGGQTNDLGEYRLFGLSPGQYILEAALRADPSENINSKQGDVPMYYPGVPDAGRAAAVSVRGGDEVSDVDISLRPVRTVKVSGHVLNAGCGGAARDGIVLLAWQNSSLSFPAQTWPVNAKAQFAFELHNLTSGSYYLYAVLLGDGNQCVGHQALEVGDADIEGVVLTATRGVEIKGRVRVEGQLDSNLGSLVVGLSPKRTDEPSGGATADAVKPDGSFLLKNAYDGDSEINVENLPGNYFVKSARMDGVDVLRAGVTIDSKHVPGLLEVVVSTNGATINGVVSKDQQPFPGATVALVPDPPHRGQRRLFKSTSTDPSGHFAVQGISPGDYKMFAWEGIESSAYTSSEFLQPYENLGESVHVTEGSRNSVQLDLIPIKNSNP